jgi:hypothetical protein
MCRSSSTRTQTHPTANHGPIDPDLVSRVALKNEYEFQQPSFDFSAFEPQVVVTPITSKQQSCHIVVQHNYHDHSNDNRSAYQEQHPARGGVTTPFPLKLHDMFENVDADGHSHIVSWQPHGRCFVVHKPKEFVKLLPNYFKLSKLPSFQRQLNLYGFQRLTRGKDRGGYYHELFLRGRQFLAHNIQRIKVKGTGVRARSNPEQEPDFWAMPWVEAGSSSNAAANATPAQAPSFPFNVVSMKQYDPQDLVCAFGNKTFHYLDPFQPLDARSKPSLAGVDQLLATEAESFFEDFVFPGNIGDEIEDDAVFGDMLEQMIS